jgi:hypothetical protein
VIADIVLSVILCLPCVISNTFLSFIVAARTLPRTPARCTGAIFTSIHDWAYFDREKSRRCPRTLGLPSLPIEALILDMSLDANADSRQASAKDPMTHAPLFQADDQPWEGGEHFFDGRQILLAIKRDTTQMSQPSTIHFVSLADMAKT